MDVALDCDCEASVEYRDVLDCAKESGDLSTSLKVIFDRMKAKRKSTRIMEQHFSSLQGKFSFIRYSELKVYYPEHDSHLSYLVRTTLVYFFVL